METFVQGVGSTLTDTIGLSVTHTHEKKKKIWRDLTAKTGADESNFLISVMKGTWHTKRHPDSSLHLSQAGQHLRVSEETLSTHGGGSKVTKHTKTPFHRFNQSHWVWQSSITFLYFNLRDVPEQTFHCCKGRNCGQNWTTERKSSPAWTWM